MLGQAVSVLNSVNYSQFQLALTIKKHETSRLAPTKNKHFIRYNTLLGFQEHYRMPRKDGFRKISS